MINRLRQSFLFDKMTWLLAGAVAMLVSGVTLNNGTTAFFTDTRLVQQNNFITASVALNETPFVAFNFSHFVPGDVFVRPVQIQNHSSTGSSVNVNYFVTIKDSHTTNCTVNTPACSDANGTLSDVNNGLRLVAVRCFKDAAGTLNTPCEGTGSDAPRSVRLVKGVMETIWPGGASQSGDDIALQNLDRNPTVQTGTLGGALGNGNVSATSCTNAQNALSGSCPTDTGADGTPRGRPIVFAQSLPLSQQPMSVKILPAKIATSATDASGTNTFRPQTQGTDILLIGGTMQDLDGNWAAAVSVQSGVVKYDATVDTTNGCDDGNTTGFDASSLNTDLAATARGCGSGVRGLPIQTLSNPNCNGIATNVSGGMQTTVATSGRGGAPAGTGNVASPAGPGANTGQASGTLNTTSGQAAAVPLSPQSHGACLMGGPDFELNQPVVTTPRINNVVMSSASPAIISDIPAQSSGTSAGIATGAIDNIALIVYLPSWTTQQTQLEAATTSLNVLTRVATTSASPTATTTIPSGGAGSAGGQSASYVVAFTAVQPTGRTIATTTFGTSGLQNAGTFQVNSAATSGILPSTNPGGPSR